MTQGLVVLLAAAAAVGVLTAWAQSVAVRRRGRWWAVGILATAAACVVAVALNRGGREGAFALVVLFLGLFGTRFTIFTDRRSAPR